MHSFFSESLSETPASSKDEKEELVELVLRPHEGQLIGQSPAARILRPDNSKSSISSVLSISPQQMLVAPGAESYLTVHLDASSWTVSNVEEMQITAFALGYLTLQKDDTMSEILQPNPFLSPQLRMNITGLITIPRSYWLPLTAYLLT